MPSTASIQSLDGTSAEVAAFCGIGLRQLTRWNCEQPPRIPFYQGESGGPNVYPEEGIVSYRASRLKGVGPKEGVELVRRAWRAFKLRPSDEELVRALEGIRAELVELRAAVAMAHGKWPMAKEAA